MPFTVHHRIRFSIKTIWLKWKVNGRLFVCTCGHNSFRIELIGRLFGDKIAFYIIISFFNLWSYYSYQIFSSHRNWIFNDLIISVGLCFSFCHCVLLWSLWLIVKLIYQLKKKKTKVGNSLMTWSRWFFWINKSFVFWARQKNQLFGRFVQISGRFSLPFDALFVELDDFLRKIAFEDVGGHEFKVNGILVQYQKLDAFWCSLHVINFIDFIGYQKFGDFCLARVALVIVVRI